MDGLTYTLVIINKQLTLKTLFDIIQDRLGSIESIYTELKPEFLHTNYA